MIQGLFMRLLALCIWLPSIALTYILVAEFTEGQSSVIFGLAMISLLVSAVSLLSARYAFRRGDRVWGYSSVAMYVLAAVVMVFLEIGFWHSSILSSHKAMQDANAAREGVEIIQAREREALKTGKIAESAAELRAKMQAELVKPIGRATLGQLTNNCADGTSAAARLCGGYFSIQAELSKAETAEKIEQRIWNAGTRVEFTGLKKDIFAGATALSSMIGGSPEMWASIMSVILMAMLMATRDLSGIGAVGPSIKLKPAQEPQEARVSPEAAPAPVAAPEPALPTVEAVSAAMKPKSPPPTNGGTRQAKPEPKPAPAPVDENKVVRIAERTERLPASAFFEEAAPPRKLRRGDRRHHPVGAAKAWLRDCTERTPDLAMTVSTQDAWDHYREWCEAADLRILPRSRFERAVSAKVGSTSIRGQRCYIGLVLADLCVEEEKVRMLA